MPWVRSLLSLAVVMAMPLTVGVSQQAGQAGGVMGSSGRTSGGFPALPETANPHPDSNRIMEDSMRMQNNQKRIAELNKLRQKEMTEDTAKLLELANEVKTKTGNSTDRSLSILDLRKVEMIEKLAHSVHDKMKATVAQ